MSDLIKRSDAIEAIECVDWYHQNRNKDMVSGANSDEHQAWYKAQDIYEALEAIPSADRPQGEWVPFEYGDDTWHKCSVCGVADKYRGSMPRPNGTIAEWEYVRNFCPNCGARMKGADDE